MNVYVLYRNYGNGVDSWDTIVGVYDDETVAGLHEIECNDKRSKAEANYIEYCIVPFELNAPPKVLK